MFKFVITFAALLFAAPVAAVAEIAGPLHVIDGDTFDVGGTRVRLHGVDAPELGQMCTDPASGGAFDCGAWVAGEVAQAFGGRQVTCAARTKDLYGRTIARCRVGGVDLGDALVRAGMALAYTRYSEDYVMAQKQASVFGRGLWALTLAAPEAHRQDI